MNNCSIEHETLNAEWKAQVIVQISNTHKLFIFKGLNIISVNFLLEFSHIVFLMLEHFLEFWIAALLPFSFPSEGEPINFGNNLLVNIFEMQNIGTVFWNVLNVAHDLMLSSTSELKIIGHLFYADI